ncbi:hypothetical protein CHU92_13590 [Flavobacterium cyanobacteriorum]|uniref:Thioredoxin domain-containing protein n=1 Tax=Flavobacterium cyanobacteriorum TaxID=2022802 RepID=A0A255YV87_9FLAO|nr:thioredoxin family protein [Flavobacterium cyanobacteriorum]OYQ33166.1 hypothetical protein CHU92_13590 [Flavobacterium cyanobacteriorum]
MKVKRILLAAIFLTIYLKGGAQPQLTASAVMEKAFATARKENKKVFLIFQASWCSWCRKMDSQMALPQLKPLFDRYYVITHLDVQEPPKKKDLENPGAEGLLAQYNGSDSGVPFFVILDTQGKVLEDSLDSNKENIGCPATKEETEEFIRILKNTSKLTNKELALIAGTFIIKK